MDYNLDTNEKYVCYIKNVVQICRTCSRTSRISQLSTVQLRIVLGLF